MVAKVTGIYTPLTKNAWTQTTHRPSLGEYCREEP